MILHIAERGAWERALTGRHYRGDTLDTQGFIHCSTPEQVVSVANRFYRGRSDLVLLCIDQELLSSEVRYELSDGQCFPHVYGPLNREAVVEVLEFVPGPDGSFSLPSRIAGSL